MDHDKSDIKYMLVTWMLENNIQDWSVDLRFVQNMKNAVHYSGIKHTPYKAIFGSDPKVSLTSSLTSRLKRDSKQMTCLPSFLLTFLSHHQQLHTPLSPCHHLHLLLTPLSLHQHLCTPLSLCHHLHLMLTLLSLCQRIT